MKPKTYRWVCPVCGAGKLAPSNLVVDQALQRWVLKRGIPVGLDVLM